MSVFQLQEWWGLKVSPDDEEFDLSCFVVGNVDNVNPASDKIAVGSQQGILRIYHPSRQHYRIEDLIYEGSLGAPILQLLLGRFIPSNDTLGLAVLHPKELAVYEIIPQGGKDGRVNFHTLQRLYKHDLGLGGKHFTSYNMCHGPFGGTRGRDMIMVQSMDGKLQIFEQSANAFSRQLVDCLVPGPVLYLPKVDAFITTNHACQAECYRYQVLASSQSDVSVKSSDLNRDSKDLAASLSMQKVKPTLVEWTSSLGETCRQMLLGNFSTSPDSNPNPSNPVRGNAPASNSEVLMICEKSMFLVKADTGGIIQQKRLERADASCACIVPLEGAAGYNFLLAGQDGTVQVFAGFNLAWAARLPTTPVHMAIGSFGGLKGMIVTIDEIGRLAVNFLGTKPPATAVMTQVRDLDYDKVDEEHRALLQVIRDSQNENRVEPMDKLLIKSQMPRVFDAESPLDVELPANLVALVSGQGSHLSSSSDHFVKITVRFYLSYSGDRPAQNVSLVISGPDQVHAVPKNVMLQKVSGLKTTPIVVKVHFYALKASLPSHLQVVVTASYQSQRGEPRVSAHYVTLPLFLCARPRPPSKTAACKLVLDTDFPALPLTEVFGDVLHAYQEAGLDVVESLGSNAVQALGLQLFHAPVQSVHPPPSSSGHTGVSTGGNSLVSILVSKNAGRYRLQAESYPALYLVLAELEQRLVSRLSSHPNAKQAPDAAAGAGAGDGGQSLLVRFQEALPVEDFFLLVQDHLSVRIKLLDLHAQLERASMQFRLIEKRLLVRFKDRNPTPLHGLDLVLKEAYDRILCTADEVDWQQQRLQQLEAELEAFAKLLAALVAMKFNLPAPERSALQAHLCPEVRGSSEQGWEETVQAALSQLLRTSLSKSSKDKDSASMASTTLDMPRNVEALKKTLLTVLDRIEKGGKLVSATAASKTGAATSSASSAIAALPATQPAKASSRK